VLGWVAAGLQYWGGSRQRTWDRLFDSLKWFEGDTQKRTIGIAVVESKWNDWPDFHARWLTVLVNQAIYLMSREKDQKARHERANLYRIMAFLVREVGEISAIDRQLLAEALREYEPNSARGLHDLDPERLKTWRRAFPSIPAAA
jgi:hypothetical protein